MPHESPPACVIPGKPGDDGGYVPAMVLSLQPRLLALRVIHIDTPEGPSTIVARRFDRPEMCSLCPRTVCDAAGGLCLVEVPGHVPYRLAGRVRLDGSTV
jgi:hypothetical protein